MQAIQAVIDTNGNPDVIHFREVELGDPGP